MADLAPKRSLQYANFKSPFRIHIFSLGIYFAISLNRQCLNMICSSCDLSTLEFIDSLEFTTGKDKSCFIIFFGTYSPRGLVARFSATSIGASSKSGMFSDYSYGSMSPRSFWISSSLPC